MPAIVAWIVEALIWVFRTQIGRILFLALAWFGVNYVTLKVVLDPATHILVDVMSGAAGSSGAPGTSAYYVGLMYQWFVVLKFPGALNLVVSAYVTRTAVISGRGFFKKASV